MNKTDIDPYRLQQRFWLDITRPIENELVHYIDDLKQKRSFTSTIRDALHLIKDLRQGSIRILLLLFPWVWDQIEAEVRASMTEPRHTELHPALAAHMARLEKLLSERTERSSSGIPADTPIPKTLLMKQQSISDEESSLEIKAAAGDGKRATQNFMRSLMAIQTSYRKDDTAESPPKSPDTKTISGDKNLKNTDSSTAQTTPGNPKKMEVSTLESPVFENDLDDLNGLTAVTKT